MTPNDTSPKRIYIAGPMRGIPEFNFPRFHAVTQAFRANGHEVFSPAERDSERHGGVNIAAGNKAGCIEQATTMHGFSLRDALNDDLHYICTRAEVVALLPGWEKSDGAQAEWRTAIALKPVGVEIIYLTEDTVKLMERAAELMEDVA